MARPRDHDRAAIALAFRNYIDNTEIPIVAAFAASQGLNKEFLYGCEEFVNLLKECTTKKEGALEEKALSGKVNCTMAIFSLKQLGWRDNLDQKHEGALNLSISGTDAGL